MPQQVSVGLLVGAALRGIKRMVIVKTRPYGLAPRQFWVLVAVLEMDSPSLNALAARLQIDEPTASRVVAALARRRLVRAAPDPRDRRRTRLLATPKAKALRRELLALAEEVRALIVAGLDAKAVEDLRDGLRHVIDNVERSIEATTRVRPGRVRRVGIET